MSLWTCCASAPLLFWWLLQEGLLNGVNVYLVQGSVWLHHHKTTLLEDTQPRTLFPFLAKLFPRLLVPSLNRCRVTSWVG